jgi:hypothetical protein
VSAEKLREWRGVKPVAAPSGVAITTRLRTAAADEAVLDAVADHAGRLRRADLAGVSRRRPLAPGCDAETRRQARRDRLNARKARLTVESSSRWANAIFGANDDQYRLARDAQYRHIVGLRAAISTIEKRLAQPTSDTLTGDERKARRKYRMPKGYATQAERFHEQRRLQVWAAGGAANASARRWPASRPRCSATDWPPRPRPPASPCSRSTPLTPAHGEISTGASPT